MSRMLGIFKDMHSAQGILPPFALIDKRLQQFFLSSREQVCSGLSRFGRQIESREVILFSSNDY